MNKLFEYLASGKPVLATSDYDITSLVHLNVDNIGWGH